MDVEFLEYVLGHVDQVFLIASRHHNGFDSRSGGCENLSRQPYNGNYAQIHPESVQESRSTPNVITRDWGSFQLLKEHEASRAEEKLNEILGIHKSLNPYLKDAG